MQDQEKDQLRKVLKFAILCSEEKVEAASSELSELKNLTYHNTLSKLPKLIIKNSQLQKTNKIYKHVMSQRDQTISFLIKQSVDSSNKQVTEESIKQQLKIFGLMEYDELAQAKKLADEAGKLTMKGLIQQILEYRCIKAQNSIQITPQIKIQTTEFQSKEGKVIYKLVKENHAMRKNINDHLVNEIKCYLKEGKAGNMSSIYFTQQFSKMYEELIKRFREIKNELSDKQQNLKEKIGQLSKKMSLGLKDSENFQEYFTRFLASVQSEFKRLEEQPKVPSSYYNRSPISEFKSQSQFSVSPPEDFVKSTRVFKKTENTQEVKTSRIRQIKSFSKQNVVKSQAYTQLNLEPQINALIDIIPLDSDEISNMKAIPVTQRLEKFAVKLKKIMGLYKDISEENGFIRSEILVSRIFDMQVETPNNIQKTLVKLPSSPHQQYQATIRGLQQQLQGQKTKNQKLETYIKYNKKRGENRSQIQEASIMAKCCETVEDLNQKLKISEQETQKLKSQLQTKNTIISNLQQQNTKIKKELGVQKQSLERLQKRFDKIKEDFNDQIQEIQKLNSLYEERFMIETQEKNCRLTQSAYVRISKEKQDLENKNFNLCVENEKLKSTAENKKETNEFGSGSQVIQPGDELFGSVYENGSFIDNMPNVSSIMERSITPNVEIDIRAYEEQINSLQKTIDVMANQHMQRQMNDQSILLAQAKEIQRLKEGMTELQKENERLKHKIQITDIRAITHNEANIKNLHLFPPGFIFGQYDYQERLFLLDNLLAEVGPIKATRLLYRSDVHNKTNFHNYIDNHRHLVIIIKTVYGKLIAGYSQQAFNPREIRKGRGIIMSLWAKKAFYVGDRKAITYDDYYLIFGNSELRIRSQQFKLFSNLAIANAYYDNKGEKVGVLLGEDNLREVDIMEYEVYKLDLEQ